MERGYVELIMNKLQKIVLLLTFHFSPDTPQKELEWEALTLDRPYDEDEIISLIGLVATGKDGVYPNWSALEQFKDDMTKAMN